MTGIFDRAFPHVDHRLRAHTQLGNDPEMMAMVIRCDECPGEPMIHRTTERPAPPFRRAKLTEEELSGASHEWQYELTMSDGHPPTIRCEACAIRRGLFGRDSDGELWKVEGLAAIPADDLEVKCADCDIVIADPSTPYREVM